MNVRRITITIELHDDVPAEEPTPPGDQVETGAMVVHVDQPRYVGFTPGP